MLTLNGPLDNFKTMQLVDLDQFKKIVQGRFASGEDLFYDVIIVQVLNT